MLQGSHDRQLGPTEVESSGAPVQILAHDSKDKGTREDCLQVPARHLKDETRRTRDDGDDSRTPLDGPLDRSVRLLLLALERLGMGDDDLARSIRWLEVEEGDELGFMREGGEDEEVGSAGEGGRVVGEEARAGVEAAAVGEADHDSG